MCCLYSMVEVLWIGWLLVSCVSFQCLCLVKVLVFATFFSSVTLSWMYQKCLLCVVLTWQHMVTIILLAFFRVFWIVWIALFTNPLLWGNSGLDVLCMNSHDLENSLNSCELYWGPLSLNTILGICHVIQIYFSYV